MKYRLYNNWRNGTFELQAKDHWWRDWYYVDSFSNIQTALKALQDRKCDAVYRADKSNYIYNHET